MDEFNKTYPNITVNDELVTDFAGNALLCIGSDDWIIMGIPTVDKSPPDEFIAALQAIKDNTDAIPLYTNYAAGWIMGV